jgi:nitroreductase
MSETHANAEDFFQLIRQRQSAKGGFDPQRPVDAESLKKIVEAARWSPTAHNLQNFEIVVVDDKDLLAELGKIRTFLREEYLREHYLALSFTEEEYLQKKVGILGTGAPPSWRDPTKFTKVVIESQPGQLSQAMKGCPALMVVTYDPINRAPGSEGDFLGIISLGCVMENIWLAASALGIGVRILSSFSDEPGVREVKNLLGIPAQLRVAYTVCLGYPASQTGKYLRVRRDTSSLAHHNKYGAGY